MEVEWHSHSNDITKKENNDQSKIFYPKNYHCVLKTFGEKKQMEFTTIILSETLQGVLYGKTTKDTKLWQSW